MPKKNPLTAAERRGILIVAVIALLITGSGMIAGRCNRPDIEALEAERPRVEVIMSLDSLEAAEAADSTKTRKKRKKGEKGKASKKKSKPAKEKRTYRQRMPLDEPVNN